MRWKFCILSLTLVLLSSPVIFSEEAFEDDVDIESLQEELEYSETEDDEILYESPKVDIEQFYFIDHFDNAEESEKRWVKSKAKKDDTAEEIAKYDGVWNFESPERIVWKNDLGLVLKSKAKHAAISAQLNKKFNFQNKPLVVQYEVTMQNVQDCGGAYIKLLSENKDSSDLTQFNDKTPYTIMFGPDKCGNEIKLHFIFRHINPLNGSISEKHCRKPKERLEEPFKDKLPHLYQLVINPDNTFQISVDNKIVNEGSLLNDFEPSVNPQKEIDDPTDKKPENWDEREKIPDPDADKPVDWDEAAPPQIPDVSAIKPNGWLEDEPEMISDPYVEKPHDWDVEIDGEWEAPLINNPICEKAAGCGLWKAPLVANPEYKGKWRAPLINNPNYQGKWSPRKIANPDFFEDLNPFKMTSISAIGMEIWSMSSDILFDNVIITDDIDVANDYSEKTFSLKRKYINKESQSFLNKAIEYTNENPWLWGVYIVVLGTPLSFIVYSFLCAKKDKVSTDDVGKAKKEDESGPDDIAAEISSSGETISSKTKKSDLDVKSLSNSDDKSSEEEDLEINEDVEDEVKEPKTEECQQPTDGARKRKSRKE